MECVLHRHGKPSGLDVMRPAVAAAREIPFAPTANDAAALKKLAKQAGDAAQLLKMLANEKRLLILCFLAVRGEMTVGELVGVVKLSQSALSQHLAKLRADGLVDFRRASQTLHYRVADPRALRLLQVLKDIYCGELK
jgi:DNA-binding transcriptional ArsR family regulator